MAQGTVHVGEDGKLSLTGFAVDDSYLLPNGIEIFIVWDHDDRVAVVIRRHDLIGQGGSHYTLAIGARPLSLEWPDKRVSVQYVNEPERAIVFTAVLKTTRVMMTKGSIPSLRVGDLQVILEDIDDSSGRARFRLHGPKGVTATVTVVAEEGMILNNPGSPEEVVSVSLGVGQSVDYICEAAPMVTLTLDEVDVINSTVHLLVKVSATVAPGSGFTIVWDPEIIDPELYAELVVALGDIVRANGGSGIERIRGVSFGVSVNAGVPA